MRENTFELSSKNSYINYNSRVLPTICESNVTNKIFRYTQINFFSYIRYLDHFVLGISGDKKCSYDTLTFISMILDSLGMKLSIEKSSVKHFTKGVVFLGYHIRRSCAANTEWVQRKHLKFCSRVFNFNVSEENLFKSFVAWGFFQRVKHQKSFKFVGRRQNNWLFLKDAYEIIYRFNSIIQRVERYYSAVIHKKTLLKFWHVMKRSAALTLAHKFNKRSIHWAFQKFGNNLTVTNSTSCKSIHIRMPRMDVGRFYSGKSDYSLPVFHGPSVPTRLNSICSVGELECAIPNCTLIACRWYYIKHRKGSKRFQPKKAILSYFAKQIPLCKSHYKLIHVGLYDGPSLRKLPGYIPRDFD